MFEQLREWWEIRKARRRWHRMSCGQQMEVMLQILDTQPDVRRAFRKALRVTGMEDTKLAFLLERGKKGW